MEPPAEVGVYEVAIVGAGPIGIEVAAAFQAMNVNYVHIEAGCIGSTIGWWAPGTRFFSSPERIAIAGVPLVVAGQEKASREEYLAYLRGVVEQFDLQIRQYERVVRAVRVGDEFELITARSGHGVGGPREGREKGDLPDLPHAEYRAKKLVLAIGNMHTPRLVGVTGEELPHVSHYLEDPHMYARRRVVIVGARNSAVEAAIRLYRVGAKVTLCTRGEELERARIKYWLLPELEWLIRQGRIEWRAGTLVTGVDADGVTLRDRAGMESQVDADAVLMLTGYVQSGELFEMLGLETKGHAARPVLDERTMEASVRGVFVAGTATAGSESKVTVFIENAHEQVGKIVRAVVGRDVEAGRLPDWEGMEES